MFGASRTVLSVACFGGYQYVQGVCSGGRADAGIIRIRRLWRQLALSAAVGRTCASLPGFADRIVRRPSGRMTMSDVRRRVSGLFEIHRSEGALERIGHTIATNGATSPPMMPSNPQIPTGVCANGAHLRPVASYSVAKREGATMYRYFIKSYLNL